MARREFTKPVYADIVKRAINANGFIVCEGCGNVLRYKKYHIDHTIPDALIVEKRKLTADDGKLLGVECCHAPKTKVDVKNIAEAKRREARHIGIRQPAKMKGQDFAITKSRADKLAKRVEKQPVANQSHIFRMWQAGQATGD